MLIPDTSNDVDSSWPPIDNYEAPYREPVFAPESPYEILPQNPAPRNIPFEPVQPHQQVNNDNAQISPQPFQSQSQTAQKIIEQQHSSFKHSQPFEELRALLNVETSTQAISNTFYNFDASKSASKNAPTSTRVNNNDFRPSLRINPSQPVSGFLPVYPSSTNADKPSSSSDTNRINRQTVVGFESLIPPTTAKPVVRQSLHTVNNSSSHYSNGPAYWDQSDSVFQSPSSGGQTVIHGIYPRIVRQRSPFGRSGLERESRIRTPSNSVSRTLL